LLGDLIPELFIRRETGTDIWVAGFSYDQNWKNAVIESILKDFFAAIHRRLLVARVGEVEINHITLPDLLRHHVSPNRDSRADQYLATLVDEDTQEFHKDDFEDLGEISLHIRLDKHGPKRVAMLRRTGMLIFEKGHFRTPTRFAGVFEARGEEINRFLRALEPPRHDAWKAERYSDDPEQLDKASRLIKKLYAWINECVKRMSPIPEADQVDAEGIGQYLPDELDDETPFDSPETDGEPLPAEIVEQKRRPIKPESIEKGASEVGPSGDGDGPTTLTPDDVNKGDGGQHGVGDRDGGDGGGDDGAISLDGGGPSSRKRPFRFERARAYCVDEASGRYKLVLIPKETGRARIRLNLVGEVEVERAKVASALDLDSGMEIPVDGQGRLGPMDFQAGKKYLLELALAEHLRCALGVDADAD
jgi:hypothetical protein